MNYNKPNSPNYYNLYNYGASGPQTNYSLVYDKLDNIPGQEVNTLFDFSTIREIRSLFKREVLKKRSGNDQAYLLGNSWNKLNEHKASNISIFNDTDQTFEIKQLEFPNLINYNHSTTFKSDLLSSVGSGVSPNYEGWGDFKTSFNIEYQMSNYPVVARNTYSYIELPNDFDVKEWSISFDINTSSPEGWTGWNPNWTLGNGYVVNIFNSWENKPSPIGLLPSAFSNTSLSNFSANINNGEIDTKGYTLFISDPKVRSEKIANDMYPDFAITGAYFSGQGALSASGTYNLVLMTDGLNANPSNTSSNVRLAITTPGLFWYQFISKSNQQTISLPRYMGGKDILSNANPNEQYFDFLIEVERAFPDGLNGITKQYITKEWARLSKNGGVGLWSNFSGIGRPYERSYSNYNPSINGNINTNTQARTRTISLYNGDALLSTKLISLDNYYNYNYPTKVVFSQKGGRFGVYLQNKFNAYDLVFEYYDRHYYAKSKVGNFLGIGSVIKDGLYGFHNINNVYLNNQKIDLNSQNSINNYLNTSSIPSIKLYPNTAIDMQICNTNQIFIYNSGNSTANIKYRWED